MATELIPAVADVPAIADDNLVAVAEAAEKRVEAINKIKRLALGVTNSGDWRDQGGKPYLQVSGAEKVARLFGMSWRIYEPDLFIEETGHYSYTYKGVFSLGGATIEAIGTRSSSDPFFCARKGEEIPPSEVDRNDVKKAAYTNMLGNGITRILGLRNLSWEDVKAGGVAKDAVGKVEYGKQEMSEDAQGKRGQIRAMLLEMCGDDPAEASKELMRITTFTAKDGREVLGKKTCDELSEKAIPVTYEKVKKEYEKWRTSAGEVPANGNGAGGNGS